MKKTLVTLLIIIFAVAQAASMSKNDYLKLAEEIRAEVYSMDLPQFNRRDVPDRHKDKSAVILAWHRNLQMKKRRRLGYTGLGLIGLQWRDKVMMNDIDRRLIHIGDKSALEAFSEIDFRTMSKEYYNTIWSWEDVKQVVGVRIIKPDGSVQEVTTDEYVFVENEKDNKQKDQKLAIPGLEIGDNLDIFVCQISQFHEVQPPMFTFWLRGEYPVLDYTIHCELDDDLTTQYRTLNGAPDFIRSNVPDDKDFALDLHLTDIDKTEPNMWYNSIRQSPVILMKIHNRRISRDLVPKSASKDGIYPNPDANDIIADDWILFNDMVENCNNANWVYRGPTLVSRNVKNGKKLIKSISNKYKKKEMTATEATDALYALSRVATLFQFSNEPPDQMSDNRLLAGILSSAKIPFNKIITSSKYNEPLDELIYCGNTVWMLESPDTKRLYAPVRKTVAAGEVPGPLQGEKAFRRTYSDKSKGNGEMFTIPTSSAADNVNTSHLKCKLSGNRLDILHTESYTGATKFSADDNLVTNNDIYPEIIEYLNTIDPKVQVRMDFSTSEKGIRHNQGLDAEWRSLQQDAMREMVEHYYVKEAEFKSGRLTQCGMLPSSPALVCELECSLDGFLKNAGNNRVMPVGRLLSPQIEIKPTERDRTDDIYMTSPRTYRSIIEVDLPDGYTADAKTLKNLERNIVNNAGKFIVSPELDGSKLKVTITKEYSVSHLDVGDWKNLESIVDAAGQWRNSTLLLVKK